MRKAINRHLHAPYPQYVVKKWDEETFCDYCGEPISIGEKVYTDTLEVVSFAACSTGCCVMMTR